MTRGNQQKKAKIIVWQSRWISRHHLSALFTCSCLDWIDLRGQWQMIALENDESFTEWKSILKIMRHRNSQLVSTAAKKNGCLRNRTCSLHNYTVAKNKCSRRHHAGTMIHLIQMPGMLIFFFWEHQTMNHYQLMQMKTLVYKSYVIRLQLGT